MRDDFTSQTSHLAKWAYLLLIVLLLMSPVFYVIVISFNEHGFGARIYEFTLEWYEVVLGDTIMMESLTWTGYLAAATVATAVPMGLLAAKFYRRANRKVAFLVLMLTPLFVPADIMGSALLVYFKNLNEFVGWMGAWLAVDWLEGLFDLGFLTALVGLIVYVIPYVFLVILITMSRYRDEQTEAARGCGASAWQAFWHVEFPQIRAGVLSACAFTAILTFNETTRTALLKGGFDTFSNVLVSQMLNIGMSGESYAMAGIMSIVSILVIGGVLLYTVLRADVLQRQAHAKAAPAGN